MGARDESTVGRRPLLASAAELRVRRALLIQSLHGLGPRWVNNALSKLQGAAGVTDIALIHWLESESPRDAIGWASGPPIKLAAENKNVRPIRHDENGRVLRPLDRGEF